ncbi:hypothetical protein ACJX0J_031525, partial [Zea mays]
MVIYLLFHVDVVYLDSVIMISHVLIFLCAETLNLLFKYVELLVQIILFLCHGRGRRMPILPLTGYTLLQQKVTPAPVILAVRLSLICNDFYHFNRVLLAVYPFQRMIFNSSPIIIIRELYNLILSFGSPAGMLIGTLYAPERNVEQK